MRRVSTSLFTVAGIAALVAVPAAGAGAQVSPTSSNQASVLIVAPSSPCNPAATSSGAYTSDQFQSCTAAGVALPTLGLTYSAGAISNVVAADSIGVHASFTGSGSELKDSVNASGIYYRYVTFGPGVGSLVFNSAVTASHSVVGSTDHVPALAAVDANVDWGFLNSDNSFGDVQDTFNYSSGPGGGDLATTTTSFSGIIDVATELGSASSFYFDVRAEAWLTVASADPIMFSDIIVLDPDITCWSGADGTGREVDCHLSSTPPAITGTPEPASLALMGTGLVGVAGFARRKRRVAAKA